MKAQTRREEINAKLSIYFLRGLKGDPKEIYRQFRWMFATVILLNIKLQLLLYLA
ncbi:MAG: hypothetical protein HOK28_20940, partial [Deltaproteobacteria bacterium]|nr:hypothetical protein [Deltaproteobacteria bacterium]